MTMRVLHHNHCFDGACSASMFAKFHRECIGGADAYEFVGLQHGPEGGIDEAVFGSGENAIVDFKYSQSPRLTWWFDHHQSAFPTPADRAAFEAGQLSGKADRQFFDPAYISCTSWIAEVGVNKFGFDISGLEDLLKWADIIDGARFRSARAAVEMQEAAMKIALVIENSQDPTIIPRIIPLLTAMPLEEVLAQPFVQQQVEPLLERHRASMNLIHERASMDKGVIYFDLTDQIVDNLSKFAPYYFFPEAVYTVALTRNETRTKISVGTDPWTTLTPDRLVNLAAICERFGGGGHARVGAISLHASEVDRGRDSGRRHRQGVAGSRSVAFAGRAG